MNRLEKVLTNRQHKALVTFITVGYPTLAATLNIVPALAEHGCDIIELGIPFSDPLADGATIQEASYAALKGGVTPGICLETAAKLRVKTDVPIIFMTYYNPVLHQGLKSFCKASAKAGVDGFIIPDLPPQEGEELLAAASACGLKINYMLAPNSPEYRIKLVSEKTTGFIYLVSLLGVTGARDSLPQELEGFVHRVRAKTTKPLYVGFGISNPEQAKRVAQIADGVIVGSRLIQLIKEHNISHTLKWVDEMRRALDGQKV